MKLQTVIDIIECLPKGHTPFSYTQNDYAFYLLKRATENATLKINQLKKSSHAALLNKPKVKDFLAAIGSSDISAEMMQYGMGGKEMTKYNLTLGSWGGTKQLSSRWTQTTRGQTSLVLQLNWDTSRVKKFQKACRKWIGNIHYGGIYHPISKTEHTLSWARIDCDLDTGEALIEEIQSDWIRGFNRAENCIAEKLRDKKEKETHLEIKRFMQEESYTLEKLKQNKKTWAEATLLAAIRFIREDLGIEKIYYHSFESGCALKRIDSSLPPRSLYTDLPRKFCMKKSNQIPVFLQNNRHFNRQSKKLNIPVEFFQLPVVPDLEKQQRYLQN